MSYKFNRGCWVESSENSLIDSYPQGPSPDGSARSHPGRKDQNRPSPPTIQQKIGLAYALFSDLREAFVSSARVNRLLHRLRADLDTSWQAMADFGIVAVCSNCDATSPQGSCCTCGIEEKYDVALLLVNLLLGVSLPQRHARLESCYFLGPRGCKLRARHMLCVDYLCPELHGELGQNVIAKIQTLMAGEVETTFLLCEEMKRIFTG